jgi:hypothetical protein
MTDLQKMVMEAITKDGTPEQRTRAALNAVRFWYIQQGSFHDSYRIDAQNPYVEGAEL